MFSPGNSRAQGIRVKGLMGLPLETGCLAPSARTETEKLSEAKAGYTREGAEGAVWGARASPGQGKGPRIGLGQLTAMRASGYIGTKHGLLHLGYCREKRTLFIARGQQRSLSWALLFPGECGILILAPVTSSAALGLPSLEPASRTPASGRLSPNLGGLHNNHNLRAASRPRPPSCARPPSPEPTLPPQHPPSSAFSLPRRPPPSSAPSLQRGVFGCWLPGRVRKRVRPLPRPPPEPRPPPPLEADLPAPRPAPFLGQGPGRAEPLRQCCPASPGA